MAPIRKFRKVRKAPLPKKKGGKRKAKASQNTKVDARLKVVSNYNMTIGNGNSSDVSNYTLAYFSALGDVPATGSAYNHFYDVTDFRAQAALYDEVCIRSFTVKFNPLVTQTTIYDQANVIPSAKQGMTQPNLYTWIDRDSTPLTAINSTYVNRLAMYDSFKQHSCYKKFSRKVLLKPLWMPTQVAASAQPPTDNTILQTEAGLLSFFGIYGQNLPWSSITTNEAFAQIEIHWALEFRGKKAVGITVTDGVVTMTPAEKFAPILPTIIGVDNSNDTGGQPRTFDPVSGAVIYVLP